MIDVFAFVSSYLHSCARLRAIQGCRSGRRENGPSQTFAMAGRHDHYGVGRGLQGTHRLCADPHRWPEQQVTIVEEDISPEAKVNYEIVDGDGQSHDRQDSPTCRRPGGQGPGDVGDPPQRDPAAGRHRHLRAARREKTPADIRRLLSAQPADRKPRSEDPQSGQGDRRRQGKGVGQGRGDLRLGPRECEISRTARSRAPWRRLKDGTGDCEEMTSLFIAICRAADIPARTVWVPGHCYPEFYLEDDKGEGHWFPCQAAGTASSAASRRPADSAKGRQFQPLKAKERQRYMAESFRPKPNGGGKPSVNSFANCWRRNRSSGERLVASGRRKPAEMSEE